MLVLIDLVRGRGAAWFVTLGVLVAIATPCRAEVDAEIDWRGPRGCPSAEVVRARVQALLANQAGTTRLRASGAVAPAASDGYVLTLAVNVNGHNASRTLRAAGCGSLSEAFAWLIALTVDPTLVNEEPATTKVPAKPREGESTKPASEPKPASDTRKPASDAEQPAKPKEREPAPKATEEDARATPDDEAEAELEEAPDTSDDDLSAASPRAIRLGVFGGVYGMGLPGAQLILGVRAGLRVRRFYGELGFGYLFARERTLSNGGEATFSSQLLRTRGCMEWGDRLRLAPCLESALIRTAGDVEGIAQPTQDQAFWLVAGAAVQASWLVRAPFELVLDVGFDLPITARPRFEIDSLGTVSTGNFVSAHTTLGVGVRY